VESIEQLEAVIDAKEQQIKPQFFEHQLASLIQRQKAAAEDVACPECKKRAIFKGYQHRQLKTRFGPTFFALPRLRCQACGRLFQLNSGCLADLKALAEANISPGLKQVAIDWAAAWPYRPAQQSIQGLISLAISQEQVRQLCLQEAVRVEAQERANFQQAYNQALAETVEVLVEEPPRLKMRPQIEPSERVYLGVDGTLIKVRAQNRLMEAKVGADRSIGRLRSSASGNGI